MDDEEVQPVMMTATCHTEGCPMSGQGIVAPFFPNATPPTYRAQCAQCSQAVTDLVPASTT
ncbi:hypothetical protein ACWCPT_29880 [Streptomyces sp. NPDC002308]